MKGEGGRTNDAKGRARNEPCPPASSGDHLRHATTHLARDHPRKARPEASPKAPAALPELSNTVAVRSPARFTAAPAVLAVAVVFLLAAAGGVIAWLRIGELTERTDARIEAQIQAREAAARYAKDLGTYDFRTMDANFRLVRENSTAGFAGELARITDAMRPLLQQTKATSQGIVLVAGVVEGNENQAVVILFLDQTITNTSTPQPRTDRNRMQVTVVKQDGLWKLDRVEAR